MKFANWMIAGALGLFLVSANPTITRGQGNGNGHGKGHDKHDRDDDDEQSAHYYKHREEEAARGWYYQNEGHLPPGLAKKDQLPPGLEKQLVRRDRCLQGSRNASSPAQKNWNAACLLHRPIVIMSSSVDTSFC